MTKNGPCESFENQTCICCMCRCGEHRCLEQLALRLPGWMRKELQLDKSKISRKECVDKICDKELPRADLYEKSTYRKSFCEQQCFTDHYPLERRKAVGNLKPFSKYGYVEKDSVYKDDFIPWNKEEQELYRAKLHVPDNLMNTVKDGVSESNQQIPKNPISDKLYNYYCPAHCVGNEKVPAPENCLLAYKNKFNLGPPMKRKLLEPEKSCHPFEKYSNYMLDYKGKQISPEDKPVPVSTGLMVSKPACPMTSETSYRSAFVCPPNLDGTPTKKGGQADSLTVAAGPMAQQTTTMLDYTDPDVSAFTPVKPPKDTYKPPSCKMETDTITRTDYQRWKELPRQEKPVKEKHGGSYSQQEVGVQRLFTTYQQDFDGMNSALCPCRVVEKYGPKVLEPQYRYTESEKPHDIFCFSKHVSDARAQDCPH